MLGYCSVQSVIAEVPDILQRCVRRDEAALSIAQKVCHPFLLRNYAFIPLVLNFSCTWLCLLQVFRSLYENASKSTYVTWLLATLAAIRDVCKFIVKEITSWVCFFSLHSRHLFLLPTYNIWQNLF